MNDNQEVVIVLVASKTFCTSILQNLGKATLDESRLQRVREDVRIIVHSFDKSVPAGVA